MLGLPPTTEINRPLPKTVVFAKFGLSTSQREHFDRDISRMAIVNGVSPHTLPALREGGEVKSFYVLAVRLKRKDYDAKNIVLLAKLIPQRLLFVLQTEEEMQLGVYQEKLFTSAWSKPNETPPLPLQGFALDKVWANIVMHVGGFSLQGENTLNEQIRQNEEQAKLRKRIEALEKKCRAEKQPRRKLEMFEELKKLKKAYNV